ncbi:MAG: hypothetical protein NZ869_02325 [Thermoanaerobaculum sp.]|nr:hypothetical protein [Thermoanaerobaculum sp.]MDW7968389.1 hypothetical protein [Thermoanaerobaculum sp.]
MRARRSVIALFLLGLIACGQPPAPRSLAGLARTRVWAGRQAIALLEDLHGGRFRPPQAVVAEYGRGTMTLYVAIFASDGAASATLQRMVRVMEHSPEFTPPRPQREEPQRFLTVGPGGHHLFWRSGRKVYWLAGEPERVFIAIQELPPPAPGLVL